MFAPRRLAPVTLFAVLVAALAIASGEDVVEKVGDLTDRIELSVLVLVLLMRIPTGRFARCWRWAIIAVSSLLGTLGGATGVAVVAWIGGMGLMSAKCIGILSELSNLVYRELRSFKSWRDARKAKEGSKAQTPTNVPASSVPEQPSND